MAVFSDEGICVLCGKHKKQHERDMMWEEWDCPKEPPKTRKPKALLDPGAVAEREQWTELTKDFRCCGELLRTVSGPQGVSFHCKPCGSTWTKTAGRA